MLKLSEDEARSISSKLKYRFEGATIIAIVQDYSTNEVLMVGHMNQESLVRTLTTGYLHLWSLSRNGIWLKGETSGNYQLVEDLLVDCDCDSIVVKVKSLGPICHTGNKTCFFRKLLNINF
ncbi:MAG: phosphoribosyl-AMP cyclohydrolase [Sulfolobales archaeon]